MAKGSSGGSGSSGWGFFGILVVLALIITYWYIIVAVVVLGAVLAGLWFLASHLWEQRVQRRQLAAAQHAALIRRADLEHQQVLQGDLRGLYGQYLPPPV